MYTEQMSIQYSHFHPSEQAQEQTTALMRELLEESPYGARLTARIVARENSLRGVVHIRSQAGVFFANATHPDQVQLLHQLVGQIRRQLDKWKSVRFTHDSLRSRHYRRELERELFLNDNLEKDGVA